jgi:hypothetical protein
MTKTVCYCYNHSDEDIRVDVLQNNGCSTILEYIIEEKRRERVPASAKRNIRKLGDAFQMSTVKRTRQ